MVGSTGSPMGKTYLSTAVTEDSNPKPLVSNTRIRLEFAKQPNPNEEGPRVYDVLRAYAGCNQLGASAEAGGLLADGRLWIDGFFVTQQSCEPPLHAQDEWLTTFLVTKPSWHPTDPNRNRPRPHRRPLSQRPKKWSLKELPEFGMSAPSHLRQLRMLSSARRQPASVRHAARYAFTLHAARRVAAAAS